MCGITSAGDDMTDAPNPPDDHRAGPPPGAAPPPPAPSTPPPPAAGTPPPPSPPPPPVPSYAVVQRWRSVGGLSTALSWLFIANIAVGFFAIYALAHRLSLVHDIEHGTTPSFDRLTSSDDLVRGAGITLSTVMLITAVLFIVWMFRSAKNNEALGRPHPRFGPGWAIGGWFIPLADFVIPVLIMQDLWRGGDASVPRGGASWRAARGSGLIVAWWSVWLVSIGVRIASGTFVDNKNHFATISDLKASDRTEIVGLGITIVAAILAGMVVRAVTRRHEACLRAQHESFDGTTGSPPPPTV